MFSALKKLTKGADDRCPAPVPMSSSLQKKFSRGVHYNMKILIKGDRNVGKSCLLQRLQGGAFIEEYVPTEQIQVAPIHWTYKNTDHIVKVEVWEVVDKGKAKKKPPLGLKLENQSNPLPQAEDSDVPVLDATFLDVYKNANGVILMMDITKPWTFEYVVKELSRVPSDLPVVILGNHCDMQHHRQVHPHHIELAMQQVGPERSAPVRYAESSMRNGFGLRLLHKFLSVPFLRLQRASLLDQLQRNQRDMEEADQDLDEFQLSEESQYDIFLDRLTNKRRQSAEVKLTNDHSPSIVLGAGKPIVPPNVNPLLNQSLNPMGIKAQHTSPAQQTQYVNTELFKTKPTVEPNVPRTPAQESVPTPSSPVKNIPSSGQAGDLEEFYAGALDSSFLDDMAPVNTVNQDPSYDSESDDANAINPMVAVDQDLDLDIEYTPKYEDTFKKPQEEELRNSLNKFTLRQETLPDVKGILCADDDNSLDVDYPLWAGDTSVRRSPEGGEDPDLDKESSEKTEKRHKKKKSKDKDSEKSEKKDKKHKHKKTKSEKKHNPQECLLPPASEVAGNDGYGFDYDEYDSI